MKIERGVMVMKDGKAWGCTYEDGQITTFGWMDPEDAPIHNPRYCKKPTDVTYKTSPDIKELRTAKVVHVKRVITVEIEHEVS